MSKAHSPFASKEAIDTALFKFFLEPDKFTQDDMKAFNEAICSNYTMAEVYRIGKELFQQPNEVQFRLKLSAEKCAQLTAAHWERLQPGTRLAMNMTFRYKAKEILPWEKPHYYSTYDTGRPGFMGEFLKLDYPSGCAALAEAEAAAATSSKRKDGAEVKKFPRVSLKSLAGGSYKWGPNAQTAASDEAKIVKISNVSDAEAAEYIDGLLLTGSGWFKDTKTRKQRQQPNPDAITQTTFIEENGKKCWQLPPAGRMKDVEVSQACDAMLRQGAYARGKDIIDKWLIKVGLDGYRITLSKLGDAYFLDPSVTTSKKTTISAEQKLITALHDGLSEFNTTSFQDNWLEKKMIQAKCNQMARKSAVTVQDISDTLSSCFKKEYKTKQAA